MCWWIHEEVWCLSSLWRWSHRCEGPLLAARVSSHYVRLTSGSLQLWWDSVNVSGEDMVLWSWCPWLQSKFSLIDVTNLDFNDDKVQTWSIKHKNHFNESKHHKQALNVQWTPKGPKVQHSISESWWKSKQNKDLMQKYSMGPGHQRYPK